MVLKVTPSRHLTRAQVERIFGASAYAYCSRRPLNEMVTIHFKLARVSQHRPFITRFLKHLNDWSRRNFVGSSCWVWVLENPSVQDDCFGGLHVHILIHVPFRLLMDFRRSAKRWLVLAGGTMRKGALHFLPLNHVGPQDDQQGYLKSGLWGTLRYLCKGIDPASAQDFQIRPKDQGVVCGRRCGYSEALGEGRRWLPVDRPNSRYVTGLDSVRRRFAKAVCPELFEFPPYLED